MSEKKKPAQVFSVQLDLQQDPELLWSGDVVEKAEKHLHAHELISNLKHAVRDKYGFNIDPEVMEAMVRVSIENNGHVFIFFTTIVEVSVEIIERCIRDTLRVTNGNISFINLLFLTDKRVQN